jgi:aromatic-amino-acid transaminase
MILEDTPLRKSWVQELEETRLSMINLRKQLANELHKKTGSDRFDFLAHHRGMFSKLGISSDLVEKIRTDFAVYMVGDSRINIAGLNMKTVPLLATAIAQTIQ